MNHFEVLIEDASGKAALEAILPRLNLLNATYRIHAYRGIGRVPRGLAIGSDPRRRILLDQLPRLVTGYGKAFADDPAGYSRFVILVCDLDTRNRDEFETEIQNVIAACEPRPVTLLCL